MLNKYTALSEQLRRRAYFSIADLAGVLRVKPASAKMLASRYTKNGLLVRFKKDFYILKEKWLNLATPELFRIANLLQVPSYISLMTALYYYEITTQIPQDYYESVAIKRTQQKNINGRSFVYYKLSQPYFFDYFKKDNIFIATKEKALVDALYLYSFGKYKIDINSLDISKLDLTRLKKLIKKYPAKTKKTIKTICRI
ncbi:MAG: hypothetical protein KGZ86_05630 [Candidatus Latescibacteria bacterium]|nr:hypothetical protein [Candidatus Latescibacterota bacterium]